MDPNLFHIDWERLSEVLVAIVIASFLVERALALLFETRFFIKHGQGRSFKEPIAFIVAAGVCWYWSFDAFSMIFLKETVTVPGMIMTGAIVAGGSKGSIKLFRDILGFMSSSEATRQKALKAALKGDSP
jgi:hypothetical protein